MHARGRRAAYQADHRGGRRSLRGRRLLPGRVLDPGAVAADNADFSYPEAQLGFCGGLIAGLAVRIPYKAAIDRDKLLGTIERVLATRAAPAANGPREVFAQGK